MCCFFQTQIHKCHQDTQLSNCPVTPGHKPRTETHQVVTNRLSGDEVHGHETDGRYTLQLHRDLQGWKANTNHGSLDQQGGLKVAVKWQSAAERPVFKSSD